MTLAYFDRDAFEAVNDNFGHAAGDERLRTFIATSTRHVRRTDVVARRGGDGFRMLFPGCDEEPSRAAILKIREEVETTIQHPIPVTTSIGAATD